MIDKNLSSTLVQKYALSCVSLLLLFVSGFSAAQDFAVVEIEIDRDANELSDYLTGTPLPKPEIASLLDTAMILTSVHNTETTAYCYANDKNGNTVGRIRMRIPAMGVLFFLASDIVDERGFVGSVICNAKGFVVGTEVMLGVVTTDIEVMQDNRFEVSSMLFPVTATK